MANYTWISNSESNWTTTANWDTDDATPTYPGSGDNAIFNNTQNGNCIIDISITVDSVTSSGTYSGNLILSNTLTITNDFTWTSGSISGASDLQVGKNCNISGCSFNCDAGHIIKILHNQSASNTFTANQTIKNLYFGTTGSVGYAIYALSGTFSVAEDLTLNLIRLSGTSSVTIQGDLIINNGYGNQLNSSNLTLTVNGDFYMTDGSIQAGIVKVDGDLIAHDNWDEGIGIIEWQKTGDETWTPNPNIYYPIIKFTSARTVTLGGPFSFYDIGISAGATLDTDDNTLTFRNFTTDISGTLTQGNSEFNFASNKNGQHCNFSTLSIKTLRISGGYTSLSDSNLNGNFTVENMIMNSVARIDVTNSPEVTGELEIIRGGLKSGTLKLSGNLNVQTTATNVGAGGTINWTQAGDITWANTGGSNAWLPTINFNSNRTITLGDNLRAYGIVFTQGILDVSNNNYDIIVTDSWNASNTNNGNLGLNPRQGTVTINVKIVKIHRGSTDNSGCPFYNLNITNGTGNASYTYNNFTNIWNIANNFTCSFYGEMELSNNSIFNIGGNAELTNLGGLGLKALTLSTWNIDGDLTLNQTIWKTGLASTFNINCQGDVDMNGCTIGGATFHEQTTNITLNGSNTQTLDADVTCRLPGNIIINNSGPHVLITNSGQWLNNIDVTNGILKFDTNNTYRFLTGKTITVRSGATLNFEGLSALSMITLREKDDSGSKWTINNLAGSSVEAHFTDIKDSTVTNATPQAEAYNSTDSGGNTNWFFIGGAELTAIDQMLIDPMKIGSKLQI